MDNLLKWAGAALLAGTAMISHAAAPEEHPAVKRPFDLAPSADLAYSISARQRGFTLSGDATITWRAGDGKYAVGAESRVSLLGRFNESRSQGTIDNYGLAPAEYTDKRFRKSPTTSTFDRERKLITFSEGDES